MAFEPWLILIRTGFAFITLLIAARILGKQTIAQMTFFDFIAAITIGAIGAGFAYHIEKNPFNVLLSLLSFTTIVYITSYLSLKNKLARKIFAGEPTMVIQNGKILEHNMFKMRYDLDHLNHQLRQKGIFDIGQVEFAIVEPNGELSVFKKSQYRPLIPADLKIPTKYEGLAIELIMDGQVIEKNLRENNLSMEWLTTALSQHRITDLKDVAYACLSTNGTLYFDLYKDKITNPVDKG
ncbi:protein of unknown function DUF421 [Desulforamulus reducens MI-1]|uniref:DUF421 domain-containing protein n=1 Tax=Desulforamulus reducens (strain ATCC BAA-1160 / DSM 100696 / MI-1) TaxID=349161 RepID=A4J206_DESRM|nr:protein of unknown function DUF421 [Desulforamulus reducens MI-1]